MNAPSQIVLDALHGSGRSPKETMGGWSFRCPCPEHVHDDKKPSGRMGLGDDGRVLLWCGRGHTAGEIIGALGLGLAALFPEDTTSPTARRSGLRMIRGGLRAPAKPRPPKPGKPEAGGGGIVAVYDYQDQNGAVIYRVGRTDDKQFPVAHLHPEHGWVWGHPPDSVKTLFNLPAVLDGVERGARIFLVEGEKDALNLNLAFPDRIDYVATTKSGGARSAWLPQYGEALRGAAVWIVADRDSDGAFAAAVAARSLVGVARQIVIVEAREGKDTSDHLAAGFGLSDFVVVAADRPIAVQA